MLKNKNKNSFDGPNHICCLENTRLVRTRYPTKGKNHNILRSFPIFLHSKKFRLGKLSKPQFFLKLLVFFSGGTVPPDLAHMVSDEILLREVVVLIKSAAALTSARIR